ncbi:MAG: sugar phosphate nucleotidyltransferase [Candidatus Latescibacterota bacterium]
MQDVRTVILGGGRGTRLFPLTKERAKPSVPIAGKFRLIDIPLSNCMHSELKEVFILTQFNSASLIHHVSETYHFSAAAGRSVRILAAAQTPTTMDWFQGTADAVRQNLRHLVDAPDRPAHLLILAGDHLYRMDYRQMLALHLESRADITVGTLCVDAQQTGRFGILRMDPGGRVTRFVEKPATPEALGGLESMLEGPDGEPPAPRYLASMGIYVFRTPVLQEVLEDPACVDFGADILPRSIDCRAVYGYRFHGYWEDIGTIRSFYEANLGLLDLVPRFNFYDESAPVYTYGYNLPDTKVNESYIRGSMLAEGSIIDRSEIIRSIVGLRCVVGADTRLDSSILMGADYYESQEQAQAHLEQGIPRMGIGRGCQIRGAIIDKNVHIGDGVVLVNQAGVREADAEGYYIRDYIVIIPRGAVIRSGTVI